MTMTAPSIKEALEDLQHFSDTQLDLNPKMQKVVATVVAALATLQPSGERREAIALELLRRVRDYGGIEPQLDIEIDALLGSGNET